MPKLKVSEHEQPTPEQLALHRAEEQIRVLTKQAEESKRSKTYWMDEAQRRREELDTALATKLHNKPIVIKPRLSTHTSETTAVLALSDWHVEETVDPDTVNGKNEYNLEIADMRIRRVFEKAHLLTNIWRNHTKIETLVMPFLGDFITGYIHEELQEGNSLSPTEAVLWVQKRLIGGIQMMLEETKFKRIVVPCCYGNHGRTTMKPRVSSAAHNSYEWLMYHNMANTFETLGEKRVEFKIESGYHNYVDIYGRTLRCHHGDWFKYAEGVGGIAIPVNKGILRWNKTIPAWMDLFGHWHQYKDDGSWLCNPSLIGYNAYAIKIKAPFELPSQTMMFIEKTHGKTATLPIWADTDRLAR